MPLTFSGTYTQNDGDEVAAGTVTVTHVDGTTGTATLDGDGAYTLDLDTSGGTVTIVEALTGVPVTTSRTGVTEGVTIDTSRDIGRVGPDQSGASVRFGQVFIATVPGGLSGPQASFPIAAGALQTIVSLPLLYGPNGSVNSAEFVGDGAADVVITYAEFTVTNQDGTEVLSVGTTTPITVTVDVNHPFTVADFGGVNLQVGSDLALIDIGDGIAGIKTTAGGVFTAALLVVL